MKVAFNKKMARNLKNKNNDDEFEEEIAV